MSSLLRNRVAPLLIGFGVIALTATGCGNSTRVTNSPAGQPPGRTNAERVPVTGAQVVLGWRLGPTGTPVQKTIDAAHAQALVAAFNNLKPAEAGQAPCRGARVTVTFAFSADGHHWLGSANGCGRYRITRDGKALQSLAESRSFDHQLIALTGQKVGKRWHTGGMEPMSESVG